MMSLAAHLAELSEKHKSLERRIEQAMAHPSTPDAELKKMKLEKLRLKEQIDSIKVGSTRH